METEKQLHRQQSDARHHLECQICLESPLEPVATLCGHLYCWKCLYEWAKSKQSQEIPCPLCNSVVNIKQVIPLYTSVEQHRTRDTSIPRRPQPQVPNYHANNQRHNNPIRPNFNVFGFRLPFGFQQHAPPPQQEQGSGFRGLLAFIPILLVMLLPYLLDLFFMVVDLVLPIIGFLGGSRHTQDSGHHERRVSDEFLDGDLELDELLFLIVVTAMFVLGVAYLLVKLFGQQRQ